MIDPVMPKITEVDRLKLINWEPGKELEKWAVTAATKKIRYDDYIVWNGARRSGCFHASETNKTCDMYHFLERIKSPRVRKRRSNAAVLDLGTAAHKMVDYWQNTRAQHKKYEFHSEYSVKPENSELAAALHLCGSTDGLSIGWPLKNLGVIWDYKTIGLKSFHGLRKPPKAYIQQLHVYMACLNVPVAVLLYIVKDSAKLMAFIIHFDMTIWVEIRDRFIKINTLVEQFDNGEDIQPQMKIGQSCYHCDFLEECEPPIPPKIKKTKSSGLPAL